MALKKKKNKKNERFLDAYPRPPGELKDTCPYTGLEACMYHLNHSPTHPWLKWKGKVVYICHSLPRPHQAGQEPRALVKEPKETRHSSLRRSHLNPLHQTGGDHICDGFLLSRSTKHSPASMERNIQPNNILFIKHRSLQIDEQMLHNTMISFGEIVNITSVPRKYSLVEFRTVEEATLAVEGLQGQLFNDPRIKVRYSKYGPAPGKEHPGFNAGNKGTRSDVLLNEHSFQTPQMDLFGQNRPMVPNNFPGQLPTSGIIGQSAPRQSFGPQGPEPLIFRPEFNEIRTVHKFQDGSSKSQMGPNWIRPSPPAPGMLSSPALCPPMQYTSGEWDGYNISQFQTDSGVFDLKGHLGPVGTGNTSGVPSVKTNTDYIWRGIIKRAGTPIFCARCVPIQRGIESELPPVIDCTGKIRLDSLEAHYADATTCSDVVFLLPDSEEDFASFTEFLHYLQSKNCAAVAMCSDSTTLFLVPPSDFVTTVLNVTVPDRLIGVILYTLPPPINASVQQATQLPAPSTQLPGPPSVHYAPASAGITLMPEFIVSVPYLLPQFPSVQHQIAAPPTYPPPQFGSVYNIHSAQYQHFPSTPNPGHPAQVVSGNSHFRDTAADLPQQGAVSYAPALQQQDDANLEADAGTSETDTANLNMDPQLMLPPPPHTTTVKRRRAWAGKSSVRFSVMVSCDRKKVRVLQG
ncbi:hypothetical protein RIF29_27940 [Crotalaria pallida]|uniref:RRM domain-containing protein n=1 Tax=Crotalaria pallida TaxID=3830 RepID=A0AAN9I1H7_CROPI